MTTIIAGSRDIVDYNLVKEAVAAAPWTVTKVVSGGARGVDTLAVSYAIENKIPYVVVRAKWEKYQRAAGYLRNSRMADMAQALIAVWDGTSRGTGHMIDIAEFKGLEVYVHRTH